MKSTALSIVAGCVLACSIPSFAASVESQTYVIQQGDTLWGLSDKFLRDPYYWPALWAKNPDVTNPHVIFPGQKIIFRDGHIEIEQPPAAPPVTEQVEPQPASKMDEPAKEVTFTVTGGEGFIEETVEKPFASIVSTYQNRQVSGEDDIVYTNIGRKNGGRVGDKYSIYMKSAAITHPVTSMIAGYKIIPLGTLQIAELEDAVSKAIIIKSYMEVAPGSRLAPYREKKHLVTLKAAEKDLSGYIIETKTGNKAIAIGDIAYLDLGESHGLQAGNMVYVVRAVEPDRKFFAVPVGKLPPEVIGALVVVETNSKTSTALVVKSIDTIYRTDRIELIKGR